MESALLVLGAAAVIAALCGGIKAAARHMMRRKDPK